MKWDLHVGIYMPNIKGQVQLESSIFTCTDLKEKKAFVVKDMGSEMLISVTLLLCLLQ